MYDASSAAVLFATMCKESMCAEQASEILRAQGVKSPGSDWLLDKLGGISYDGMHYNARRILRRTVRDALKVGMMQHRCLVAIDRTKIERCDKNPDMRHLIKIKGRGTNTAIPCVTARTADAQQQFHLACMPVTGNEFNPYFVRKILDGVYRLHLRPRLLLVDREFYAVDARRVISRAGLRFLMPAAHTAGIRRRVVREFGQGKRDRESVSRYVLRAHNGDKFECTLIMAPRAGPADGDRYTWGL